MLNSDALRRLVAVGLLVTTLVVLPAPVAMASGEDSGQAAETEETGIVQQAIEWLLSLFGGAGPDDGDYQPQIDPMGRA